MKLIFGLRPIKAGLFGIVWNKQQSFELELGIVVASVKLVIG